MNLAEQVILITGAARGIGAATVNFCLRAGANVIANCRTEAGFVKLCAEQDGELQQRLSHLQYDVCDKLAVQGAFKVIQSQYGRLDALVNNAGILHESPIAMTKTDTLEALFEANSVSSFQHIQLASRLMTRHRTGAIVNLASIVGENGSNGQVAYSMSKAAVSALTRSAAKELGGIGIRVNAVAPGFVETDLTSHYSEQQKSQLLSQIPLNRFGQVDDVAKTIVFLLSDDAAYITGQVLGVDGAFRL